MTARVTFAALAVLAVALVVQPARAVDPVGCVFPNGIDHLTSKSPRETLGDDLINKWQCLLNALQERAHSGGVPEHTCALVTVPPGEMVTVTLPLQRVVTGYEPTYGSVTDHGSPGRLEAFWERPSGTTVVAQVFNHDGASARAGDVCAQVTR